MLLHPRTRKAGLPWDVRVFDSTGNCCAAADTSKTEVSGTGVVRKRRSPFHLLRVYMLCSARANVCLGRTRHVPDTRNPNKNWDGIVGQPDLPPKPCFGLSRRRPGSRMASQIMLLNALRCRTRKSLPNLEGVPCPGRRPPLPNIVAPLSPGPCATANLSTKILDFRGFDSSRISSLRGGILMSTVNSPEVLSQRTLGRIILVGRLGAKSHLCPCRHA